MPEDLRQIEWNEYNQTVLHPLALALLLVMFIFLLTAEKKRVFIPMIIISALITSMQRIVVFSYDMTMIRIMLLGLFLRARIRRDGEKFQWTLMDSFLVLYVISASITYIALWRTASAVANRLGFTMDVILTFFGVRLYIREREHIYTLIRGIAVISFIVAFFMLIEQLTQYNLFHIFGGVREFTWVREGRMRAQGVFSHPILAGTFGAVFFPLSWSLWYSGKHGDRTYSVLGIIGGIGMALSSASSGPILSLAGALFAMGMLKFRSYSRRLIFLFVLGLIVLSFFMDAPVWHLIARIDIVGGSTGWHRYALIDAAINHFPEWLIFGVKTTGHWGWGLNDVTNMFVLQGVRGGIITLLLFIIIIYLGFKKVSHSLQVHQNNENLIRLSWAWGSVLFAHFVSFFGISYFGQMDFFWYLTLGIISALPEVLTQDVKYTHKAAYLNEKSYTYR
ncbi:MAG: hypothetical protein ACOCUV_00465 [bacterium]